LSSPAYFGHGAKEASRTGRRLDLGQTSRDLAIKRQLLELGEGQVAEAVMPAHEFGLVVDCGRVDMLVFLKLGLTSKVSGPILVASFFSCILSLAISCLLSR
jgi:hypothetical protein